MLLIIAMVLVGSIGQGSIVLNEIMYNPDGKTLGLDEQMEWIEVYNTSDSEVDLAGMMLNDGNNQLYLESCLLAPGGYAVACADESAFREAYGNGVPIVPWSGEWITMRNSADDLILYSSDGTATESLSYSDSWGASGADKSRADGEGASLERIDPLGSNDMTNWRPSEDFANPVEADNGDPVCWGTPGAKNSVAD